MEMSLMEELRVLEGFRNGGEDGRSTERDSIDFVGVSVDHHEMPLTG